MAAPVCRWARTAPSMTRCSWAVQGAWQPISPMMPARTSVPQAPSCIRLDHLLGEVLDAARGIGRILVGVHVVAAAHDDVGAGGAGDLDEAEGIGTEPTR